MEPWIWGLILVGIGFLVIVVELFIPSAGILGVVAGILLVSGVVTAFFTSIQAGFLVLLVTSLGLPVLIAFLIKIWPSTPIGKRILIGRMTSDDVMPRDEAVLGLKDLVGQLGVAKTKMLPSGLIVINGRKYDAVSEGFAIETGDAIKVVAVRGNRIYVQPYTGEELAEDDLPARDQDLLSQSLEELGIDDDPLG